jgi:hypothetical protein
LPNSVPMSSSLKDQVAFRGPGISVLKFWKE